MDRVREAAMLILYKTDKESAYSNMALKECFLKNKDFSAKDKAFITNLVYGTIKAQITIDYIIGCYSKVKLKKISPYILAILRVGIYQLKFMDKVPDSAAVNESVKLAKRYGHSASAGFVNGILRNVLRCEISYPEDEIEALSVKHSYPLWMVKRWCEDFGKNFAEELMDSMNKEPEVSLRVNLLKTTPEKVLKSLPNGRMSELSSDMILSDGFDVAKSREYQEGFFTPQDISASFSARVLMPKAGDKVLDMCAAPGGKTTHLAEIMENKGEILALDIHEHKIKLIEENAKRLGIDIISAKCVDATVENPEFFGKFSKVLADVPCSGLGIIRRKPDIKLKKKEDGIEELQYKILKNASKYLSPDGELLYSTCTIDKRENEEVIERFLKENEGFQAVDISDLLPEVLRKPECKKGYTTFYPNVDGIDGFFIAKIKKV